MFRASIGGRDAALRMYRHALVRVMIRMLPALSCPGGWSATATGGTEIPVPLTCGASASQCRLPEGPAREH
jgi:hypothetical protein